MTISMLPCAAEALVRGEPPALARILDRALEGREISREEGVALAEAGPEAVGPLAASFVDSDRNPPVYDLSLIHI